MGKFESLFKMKLDSELLTAGVKSKVKHEMKPEEEAWVKNLNIFKKEALIVKNRKKAILLHDKKTTAKLFEKLDFILKTNQDVHKLHSRIDKKYG